MQEKAPQAVSGSSNDPNTTPGARSQPSNSLSGLAFAYLLHLIFPLLLLLDVMHARHLQMTVRGDLVVGGIAAVWLFVAGVSYFRTQDRARFLNRLRRPLLSFYAVIFALILVESGLRLARRDLPPAIWRPGTRLVFRPDLRKFPGVSSVSHFRANEFGLRGPSLPSGKGVYKIVAMGGSTTLCLMLDDQKTWPQQLMDIMNHRQSNLPVWVSNAGVNGHTATHHLMLLRSLPILRDANLALFMVGMNDFQFTLSHEGAPTQALLDAGADQFRWEMLAGTYSPYPLYRRLRIYRFFRRASDVAVERTNQEDQKETLNESELRRLRGSRPAIPMPDISLGLAEYRQRFQDIATECHQLAVRCLFLTQPSIWRPDLPVDSQSLLLFGWVGPPFQPRGHVSMADLQTGLDSYNQVMLDMCKEGNAECLDLASTLPKDNSVFYDDVHFTEVGARLVAEEIATYLLSKPPFQQPSGSSARNQGHPPTDDNLPLRAVKANESSTETPNRR
jgi:lysophospholipase L1-like esterase